MDYFFSLYLESKKYGNILHNSKNEYIFASQLKNGECSSVG
ncbi:unknown [Tannerella sp. CAG:118]|nr:unknown [Tannerella sp. CAG:118]